MKLRYTLTFSHFFEVSFVSTAYGAFDIVEIEETPNRYRGIWANWEEWSTVCQCIDKEEVIRSGPRNSLRRYRACPCPPPDGCHFYCGHWYDHHDEKPCVPDSQWGAWGQWNQCSVTAGKGKQKRVRSCESLGCTPESDCPAGAREQERECGGQWAAWTDNWDACQCRQHLTHTETQLRSRLCNCIIPDPDVTDQNQTIFPTVIDLKMQSLCDVPCGPNQSTYDQSNNSNGNGESEFRSCIAADDAKWDQWQEWSTCSSSTGLGAQTRTHVCSSLGCTSASDCTQVCSEDFKLYTQGSDQFCASLTQKVRGDQAFDTCHAISGYMPQPTSTATRNEILAYFVEARKIEAAKVSLTTNQYGKDYWLGAERRLIEGDQEYRWISSGQPMTCASWHSAHTTQTQTYLSTHHNNAWQDRSGSDEYVLFCLQVTFLTRADL